MQKQPSVAHSSTAISNYPSSHSSHIKPSFVQTLKEGFAFGVGNSIAHSFMRSIFGSSSAVSSSTNPTQSQPQIEQETTISRSIGAYSTQDLSGQLEYLQCIKEGGTEEGCKQYMI
jgi:hypothetical protein